MNSEFIIAAQKLSHLQGTHDKTCFASKKGRNWERKWKESEGTRRLTIKKERKKKYIKM